MRLTKVAVAFLFVALLAGSTPAYADGTHNNLSLTFSGAILSSGTQSYSSTGGSVVVGSLLGKTIDPTEAQLDYSVQARVSGLSVQGSASFSLSLKGDDGSVTTVKGNAPIAEMIPAETFPIGCTFGADCTSGIPGIYLGLASVTSQTCPAQGQKSGDHGVGHSSGNGNGHGNRGCSDASQMTLPMEFESAFLNPFGGPIFISSQGGEIFLIATYTSARVIWTGIQLGGSATGSLAGSPVSGGFAMGVSAVEDLKSGSELEVGSIALVGMSPPSLNAAGHFIGRSTIPPGTACPTPPPPYQPFPPGTCQLTGFSSNGLFSMQSSTGGSIVGSYSTIWTAPAVAFTSTVTAILSSGNH